MATELTRDLKDPIEAHDRFLSEHLVDDRRPDAECEALTKHEIELGRFERLGCRG